jgi:hypothetical protein
MNLVRLATGVLSFRERLIHEKRNGEANMDEPAPHFSHARKNKWCCSLEMNVALQKDRMEWRASQSEDADDITTGREPLYPCEDSARATHEK